MLEKITNLRIVLYLFPKQSSQRILGKRLLYAIFPLHSRRRTFARWILKNLFSVYQLCKKVVSDALSQGIKAACRRCFFELHRKRSLSQTEEFISDEIIKQMVLSTCKEKIPKVSIISVAYRKERELPYFLEALFRQNYPGKIELVLVDDKSPDASIEVAQKSFETLKKQHSTKLIELIVLKNEKNLGNCESRNNGFAIASGEIVCVVDADCLLNRSCISRHVLAITQGPFDVSIGALNLETDNYKPLEALVKFENNVSLVSNKALPQDGVCLDGFVNCITRNFCIKKDASPVPLFDPDFGYSADPNSGIGWEDVEMGKRLYDLGLRIVYIPHAFSVHISHPTNTNEQTKPERALRNFRKLLEKHNDLAYVAPRWVTKTFQAHLSMPGAKTLAQNHDCTTVEKLLQKVPACSGFFHKTRKRLRVLTYHWHTSHQYELFKLPHDFYLLRGIGHPFGETWNYDRRPKHANVQYLNVQDLNENDFDLAIVPFDENILAPQYCNGLLPKEWGNCFKWFSSNLTLPKIGLCHGSPQFHGQCQFFYSEPDRMETREEERQRLVDATRHFDLVVCNSVQVKNKWRFVNSQTIWHGMDAMEFLPRSKNASGILCMSMPPMITRPFCNGYYVYRAVQNLLPDDIVLRSTHPMQVQGCTQTRNFYARAKFSNYIDAIRSSSVFFNPTNTSPMPRSRAEAMFCGLVSVSMKNHDVDMFINNGTNGFYAESPEELAEQLTYCMRNPDAAYRIGMAGRQTACNLFGLDRYLADWQKILDNYS